MFLWLHHETSTGTCIITIAFKFFIWVKNSLYSTFSINHIGPIKHGICMCVNTMQRDTICSLKHLRRRYHCLEIRARLANLMCRWDRHHCSNDISLSLVTSSGIIHQEQLIRDWLQVHNIGSRLLLRLLDLGLCNGLLFRLQDLGLCSGSTLFFQPLLPN